jgi:hypothetical protein
MTFIFMRASNTARGGATPNALAVRPLLGVRAVFLLSVSLYHAEKMRTCAAPAGVCSLLKCSKFAALSNRADKRVVATVGLVRVRP